MEFFVLNAVLDSINMVLPFIQLYIPNVAAGITANLLSNGMSALKKEQPLSYQMILCLEDALRDACEKAGISYDDTDALPNPFFTEMGRRASSPFNEETLAEALRGALGNKISPDEYVILLDTFADAVFRQLVKKENEDLWKYLVIKGVLPKTLPSPTAATLERCLTANIPIADVREILGRDKFAQRIAQEIERPPANGAPRIQLTGMGGMGKTVVLRRLYALYLGRGYEGAIKAVGFLTYSGSADDMILQIKEVANAAMRVAEHDRKQAAWQRLRRLASEHSLLLLIDDVSATTSGRASGSAQDTSFKNLFSVNAPLVFASRALREGFTEKTTPPLSLVSLQSIYKKARGAAITKDEQAPLRELFKNRAGSNTLVVRRLGAIAREKGFDVSGLSKHLDALDFSIHFTDGSGDAGLQEEVNKLYDLNHLAPLQRDIVEAFSFFPALALEMDTCVEWLKKDADTNEDALRTALTDLAGDTWLQRSASSKTGAAPLLMHQLVAAATTAQSNSSILEHQGLLNASAESLSYGKTATFQDVAPLVPIAQSIVGRLPVDPSSGDGEQPSSLSESWAAAARLLNWLGGYHHDAGAFGMALEHYDKARAIREDVLGGRHPDTATSYNNIGAAYRALGDYDKALEWHGKARAIREEVLGDKHPDTAMSYNNIGAAYRALGDYDKALEWYDKARVIDEEVLGDKHPDTATDYNNIGMAYHALGDYGKALEYCLSAFCILLGIFEPSHPSLQTIYGNMQVIYQETDYELPFDEWLAAKLAP